MTDQTELPAWIDARWPAPARVHAGTSTRLYGFSQAPYHSLNLGDHVGDNPQHVLQNREYLTHLHGLPAKPFWLQQVHGNRIINLDMDNDADNVADGVFTSRPDLICGILTADCLPILICNESGTEIAALHGGWRGLAAGIIEQALPMFSSPPATLMVWMGPAISARNYEVGEEVKTVFNHLQNILQIDTFIPTTPGHWLISLYRIAMLILKSHGVERIYGGQYCSYRDQDLFYSYRRDGTQTGRMASLIWMESETNDI